jgi:hypothetical protein
LLQPVATRPSSCVASRQQGVDQPETGPCIDQS